MKDKVLKFNVFTVLLGLKWTIFYILGYYTFVYIIFQDFSIFDNWYAHIWPILTTLPDIYLIVSYFFEDFKKKFTIGKNFISDDKSGKKYYSDDIQKVVIHKYGDSDTYKIASFMYYKYVEVVLKNNEKLIITSLTKSNIDEFLKENLKGVYFDNDGNTFL